MYNNMISRLLSIMLVVVLVFNLTGAALATDSSEIESSGGTASSVAKMESTNIVYGDGYIEEQIIIDVNGAPVYMTRTSYENNTAVLEITENGVTTRSTHAINYEELKENLSGTNYHGASMARGRVDGYTYTYLRTISQTSYCKESYTTYSALLSAVSIALAAAEIPGANIVAIASLLYSFSASSIDAKFVTYRHWYEVTETSSGAYLSYYCEWSTFVYAKDTSGNYVYMGKESGDFDSFDIY